MNNFLLLFRILSLLIITGQAGFGQCVEAPGSAPAVQYTLSYDPVAKIITASYVPSDNQTHRLVTGQFTIITPNGFTTPGPNGRDANFQITNINGAWLDFTVDDELIASVGQTPPASLHGYTVHQVGKAPAADDVDPDGSGPLPGLTAVTAGVPVPLFSFPANGCAGVVRVLTNGEPIKANLLSQFGFNINNELSIQIPVVAFQPALDRYCSNVNESVTIVIPDIETKNISLSCPSATYTSNYFAQVLGNWNPASLPAGTYESSSKVWGTFTVSPTTMQSNVTIDAATGSYTVNFPTAAGFVVPTTVSVCNTVTDDCGVVTDSACVVISAPECPLPVEFIYFKGKTVGSEVELSWGTAWEAGAESFSIERSATATEFLVIGKVQAAGDVREKQFYSFRDNAPQAGVNYYRIRQTDTDGSYVHTRVIAIDHSPDAPAIRVLGNPTKGVIRLKLFNVVPSGLALTNAAGSRVPFSLNKTGEDQVILEPVSGIPGGLYFLKAPGVPSLKVIIE